MKRLAATVLGLVMVAASCSSGSSGGGDDAGPAKPVKATKACEQGPTVDPVQAAPVAGTPSDRTITSFDGTLIRVHWFPAQGAAAGKPAPTVLMGPGWGQPGDTEQRTESIGHAPNAITPLRTAGYNVLTWDPRGFGQSTGEANVDDPDHEGRDVQVLLDWVAAQPQAQLDGKGDPRVGMIGGSYGGGIQFVTAARDCRVDVLVPSVAWHSLETSLYPHETSKAGWAGLLSQAATVFHGHVDEHVTEASEQGLGVGVLDDDLVQWFRDRGPADLVDEITVPTLIIQGTVDNLFTLAEGVENYEALEDAGTPVAMMWTCGGHGVCLTEPGDAGVAQGRTRAWLDRYLKGDAKADLGPTFDVVDQDGTRWVGDAYPAKADEVLEADGDGGTLALTADSKAGPVDAAANAGLFDGVVAGITPARAAKAVDLPLTADDDALVVGAPHVTFSYEGTAPTGVAPTRVFAQLVDDATGIVLGNQITPIPVTLDGKQHTAKADLELVAYHLKPGAKVVLQLVATTPAYATPRLGGEIEVTKLHLELPVTTSLRPVKEG